MQPNFTLKGHYSDIILGKIDSSDRGFSFEEVPVTFVEGMRAGMLVSKTGELITTGNENDTFGVLVDRSLLDGAQNCYSHYAVGDKFTAEVAVRGITFNKYGLLLADGTPANDAAIAALIALGNKVTDFYFGNKDFNKE